MKWITGRSEGRRDD